MRVTPTKLLNAFTVLILLLMLYTIARQAQQPKSQFTNTCDLSPSFIAGLHQLAYDVHDVLLTLGIAHVLCFGSLFGQLRMSQSLPWETDVEMCVLNEEISQHDEVFLKRAFWRRDLNIEYDSANGVYAIKRKSDFDGLVQLIVFAKDKDIAEDQDLMYHRVGWKRRMLPPDCSYSPSLQCFPSRLVTSPLPLKLFGSKVLPVPREEFEMLKYHFPDSWWREEKALNC